MTDFKVADIALADTGRIRIELAEKEMKGLLQLRKKYSDKKPLKGERIAGCLKVTSETAVLIESLIEYGAEVRWCSSDPKSSDDCAAAAVAKAGVPIFAWKGETDQEFEWCKEEVLKFKDGGPTIVIDFSSIMTTFMHLKHPEMLKTVKGIVEHVTIGIKDLHKLKKEESLKVPVLICHDAAVKSKFDDLYTMREIAADGIKRATKVQIAGKTCIVCGYGDVGKGTAQSLRGFGGRVIIDEVDPICGLQAAMEGYQVKPLEDCIAQADIVVSAAGGKHVVKGEHISKMKDHAILTSIGYWDSQIDTDWIEKHKKSKVSIRPHVDRYTFEDGKSLIFISQHELPHLGVVDGSPSFVRSVSLSSLLLGAVEFHHHVTPKYSVDLHSLPKEIDEEIAGVHLEVLGGKLTKLSECQADYIGISIQGPFKRDSYRY